MNNTDIAFLPLAFLIGMLVGMILRGAGKRRQTEEFRSRIKDLENQLNRSPDHPDAERTQFAKPKRLTPLEFIQVLGALAALAAALGAGKIIEGKMLKSTCADDLKKLKDSTEDLLGFPTADILELTRVQKEVKKGEILIIDNNWYSLECRNGKDGPLKLTYLGHNPARLDCKSGSVLLKMETPTSLIVGPKR